MSTPRRRLPQPWTVNETAGGYRVTDTADHLIAFVYFKQDWQVPLMPQYLTQDEARRVAKAISRPPSSSNSVTQSHDDCRHTERFKETARRLGVDEITWNFGESLKQDHSASPSPGGKTIIQGLRILYRGSM